MRKHHFPLLKVWIFKLFREHSFVVSHLPVHDAVNGFTKIVLFFRHLPQLLTHQAKDQVLATLTFLVQDEQLTLLFIRILIVVVIEWFGSRIFTTVIVVSVLLTALEAPRPIRPSLMVKGIKNVQYNYPLHTPKLAKQRHTVFFKI